MMMTIGDSRNENNNNNNFRYPFTASQLHELEQQVLVFKYIVSAIPVPPDLLFAIRRNSISSNLLLPPTLSLYTIGWNRFPVGSWRKADLEPGRCRRTDGKKWRCSKEAHHDSKYCQRHMHRGRNRSRKLMEIHNNNLSTNKSKHISSSPKSTNFNFMNPTNADCRISLYSLDAQEKQQQRKNVMHHFLDEWSSPKGEDATDKWPNNADCQRTPKLLHDFFMTPK